MLAFGMLRCNVTCRDATSAFGETPNMPSTTTPEAFDALIARTGLPLSAAQKATLLEVYPTLQSLIARATAPMPREAEPGLIFVPEVR
jgi:hypothetical protein